MVTKEPRTSSKEIKGELQGRTIRPKRTPLLKANHKKARLTSHKASGRMSFGQMRQNWSFLARQISSMFTDAK